MTTATTSRTSFAQEVLSHQFVGEAWPLLQAHKDEIAHYADIPLEPDLDAYLQRQGEGALRLFTVRTMPTWDAALRTVTTESQLVGYAIFVVVVSAHYRSSLQANQDVLYVAKEYRGTTAFRFIQYCEDHLRAEGVQAVYQHLKVKHDHPELMARLGYEHVDNIYAKRLDR